MRAELWHSLRPLLAAGGSHKAQDWKLLPTGVPPTPTQLQAPPPVLGGSQVWGVGQAVQVTEALPILACVSRQGPLGSALWEGHEAQARSRSWWRQPGREEGKLRE